MVNLISAVVFGVLILAGMWVVGCWIGAVIYGPAGRRRFLEDAEISLRHAESLRERDDYPY